MGNIGSYSSMAEVVDNFVSRYGPRVTQNAPFREQDYVYDSQKQRYVRRYCCDGRDYGVAFVRDQLDGLGATVGLKRRTVNLRGMSGAWENIQGAMSGYVKTNAEINAWITANQLPGQNLLTTTKTFSLADSKVLTNLWSILTPPSGYNVVKTFIQRPTDVLNATQIVVVYVYTASSMVPCAKTGTQIPYDDYVKNPAACEVKAGVDWKKYALPVGLAVGVVLLAIAITPRKQLIQKV